MVVYKKSMVAFIKKDQNLSVISLLITITIQVHQQAACKLNERGDQSCMIISPTAVELKGFRIMVMEEIIYNMSMSLVNSSVTANKQMLEVVSECNLHPPFLEELGQIMDFKNRMTRSWWITKIRWWTLKGNLTGQRTNTSCKMLLREKLRNSRAKIWMFRKELIHQVNSEITTTWLWALSEALR